MNNKLEELNAISNATSNAYDSARSAHLDTVRATNISRTTSWRAVCDARKAWECANATYNSSYEAINGK